jgi:hypothetical protein
MVLFYADGTLKSIKTTVTAGYGPTMISRFKYGFRNYYQMELYPKLWFAKGG